MNCARILNKYGLSKRWVGGSNSNRKEWELALEVGDDTNYDTRKWKGLIKNKVIILLFFHNIFHTILQCIVWKSGKRDKQEGDSKMYSEKSIPKREKFYNGDWRSRLLFSARTNSLEVEDRTYRFDESRDKICLRCYMRVDETEEHTLVECLA